MQEQKLNQIAVKAFRSLFSRCPDFCNLQSTFYGWVAFLSSEKQRVVIKFCRQPGRLCKEIQALKRLKLLIDCKVPEVIFFGQEEGQEYIVMDWVEGVPAYELPQKKQAIDIFSEHLTDLLIEMHDQPQDHGFELMANQYDAHFIPAFETWMSPVLRYLTSQNSPFSTELKKQYERLWESRVEVLSPMNDVPSFVHDDCHLGNVLFDPETYRVTAILDPADAGVKHREFDLFHLNDVRPELDLMSRYVAKSPLAEGYEARRWYFSLWDDAKHASNIGWYDEQHLLHKMKAYQRLSKC
ncbi:phosphotransferase [Photobacterium sp. 1_MG-2023]|uniref:phosphotransferase n=1 Tax=Photobacterium sp. 1_MG-2023 TaxID=3062646 RepID=UPI0026E45987|nr:phosphotransferase [Photobacterium sp. 1_MG-2023]MDO6706709.1 phosphotransferase [Photobacterium sp. 1_MG-2023]